jgi:hypothetical protein
MSPNLALDLQTAAELMPYLRQTTALGVGASCSFKTPRTLTFVNRDCFFLRLLAWTDVT